MPAWEEVCRPVGSGGLVIRSHAENLRIPLLHSLKVGGRQSEVVQRRADLGTGVAGQLQGSLLYAGYFFQLVRATHSQFGWMEAASCKPQVQLQSPTTHAHLPRSLRPDWIT